MLDESVERLFFSYEIELIGSFASEDYQKVNDIQSRLYSMGYRIEVPEANIKYTKKRHSDTHEQYVEILLELRLIDSMSGEVVRVTHSAVNAYKRPKS